MLQRVERRRDHFEFIHPSVGQLTVVERCFDLVRLVSRARKGERRRGSAPIACSAVPTARPAFPGSMGTKDFENRPEPRARLFIEEW